MRKGVLAGGQIRRKRRMGRRPRAAAAAAAPVWCLGALLLLVAACLLPRESAAFSLPAAPQSRRHRLSSAPTWRLSSTSNDEESSAGSGGGAVKEDIMNPVTRASWYAVEAFGKVFGGKGGAGKGAADAAGDAPPSAEEVDLTRPPRSLPEALRRIQLDNDRSYFLSGDVDSLAYDDKCVFADPFVSFEGRDRFVDNLSNLGSFVTAYDAKMLNYDVEEDGTTVQTRVTVKLELNLPWKPILAWPWGVRYNIDPETFLITSHEESWDIEPWEGVKQIFRKPTVRIN